MDFKSLLAGRFNRVTALIDRKARVEELARTIGREQAKTLADSLRQWTEGLSTSFDVSERLSVSLHSAAFKSGEKAHVVNLLRGRWLPDAIITAQVDRKIRIGSMPEGEDTYGKFILEQNYELEDVEKAVEGLIVLTERELVERGILRKKPGVDKIQKLEM